MDISVNGEVVWSNDDVLSVSIQNRQGEIGTAPGNSNLNLVAKVGSRNLRLGEVEALQAEAAREHAEANASSESNGGVPSEGNTEPTLFGSDD